MRLWRRRRLEEELVARVLFGRKVSDCGAGKEGNGRSVVRKEGKGRSVELETVCHFMGDCVVCPNRGGECDCGDGDGDGDGGRV